MAALMVVLRVGSKAHLMVCCLVVLRVEMMSEMKGVSLAELKDESWVG